MAIHATDLNTCSRSVSIVCSIDHIGEVEDQVARDLNPSTCSGRLHLDVVADVDRRPTQDVVDLGEVVGKLDAGVGVDVQLTGEVGVGEWCL